MRRLPLVLALASLAAHACKPEVSTPPEPQAPQGPSVADYEAWVDEVFADYFDRFPVTASALGEHGGDARWPKLDAASRGDHLAWAKAQLERAEALRAAPLSLDQRVDLDIWRTQLAQLVFEGEVEQSLTRDPLAWSYLIGAGLDNLINRDYAPLETRAQALGARLEALPELLVTAADALSDAASVRRPQAEVAKGQLEGLRYLIRIEIPEKTKTLDEGLRERIAIAGRRALTALDAYEAAVLSDARIEAARGEWRLGPEAFAQKLALTLGYPPGETVDAQALHTRARAAHGEVRARMESLAFDLYEPLFGRRPPGGADELGRSRIVREVLDELAKLHATPEGLRDACEANLDTISAFVEAEQLVPLDPQERLEVIWTPPHQRGVAIAGLDPAPPLDPSGAEGLQSFYLVQPMPEDWSAEVRASFLREYNHFMLEILSIHEAIPGHFVQLYYAKRDDSKVRKVFGNGPFIEGWAVYTEKLMVDAGYPGVDPTTGKERPKDISERLWKLAQDPQLRAKAIALHGAKFYLRTVTNAILDYEIHAGTLDEAGAMKLMVEGAYQQEGEAKGKWVRARVTSTQLSTYFVGATAWFDLRAAAEADEGFSPATWHAEALSHGAPPMPALAELLAQ